MTKKNLLSQAAAAMGRKGGPIGGRAKVPKGFAKMDEVRRQTAREKSLETRRRNRDAKKQKEESPKASS